MKSEHAAELQRIGKNMKLARVELDLTQEEVAFALSESGRSADRGYVSRLERGQLNPSATTVIRLARVLGVSPAKLFDGLD